MAQAAFYELLKGDEFDVIRKVRDVMAARAATVGAIERDPPGTRYFQIRDPEGNEIEIVQEP